MSSQLKRILILNGPNLNLLGLREPEIYGSTTLADIEKQLQSLVNCSQFELDFIQSNYEGELVEKIHSSLLKNKYDFIIINPAAFTHTSVALRDAILAVKIPFIEVHISNVFSRESFRHHSYFSDIAIGVISGLGIYGYTAALNFAIEYLKTRT